MKFMMSLAREEECIWYDELHPTSAFYKVLTEDLYEVLMGVKDEVGKDKGGEREEGELSNGSEIR